MWLKFRTNLSKKSKEEKFQWISVCNSISYSVFVARSASNLVWYQGEPSGGTSENCMVLSLYGVLDIGCTVGQLAFICVQELSEEKYFPAGNYFSRFY